jgi:hypothetical protein
MKEIYHYTTAQGLLGIISRKKIWATDITFLNDKEEQSWFFKKALAQILQGSNKKNNSLKLFSQEQLDIFCKNIYESILSLRMATYVTSFCYAKDYYEKKNGLLSQWRGYGSDGGYALIFKEQEVDELLRDEKINYTYNILSRQDVTYLDESVDIDKNKLLKELIAIIRESSKNPANGRDLKINPVTAYLSLSATIKHNAFHEEKETRIIAVPHTKISTKVDPNIRFGKTIKKPVCFRGSDGLLIPYIELLLENDSIPLPLVGVIIGPHPDAARRRKSVEILLQEHSIKAEVSISDIPFLK